MGLYESSLGNAEYFSTWSSYEAQLDDNLIRWIIQYCDIQMKAPEHLNTDLHRWWKFVNGSISKTIARQKVFNKDITSLETDHVNKMKTTTKGTQTNVPEGKFGQISAPRTKTSSTSSKLNISDKHKTYLTSNRQGSKYYRGRKQRVIICRKQKSVTLNPNKSGIQKKLQ